MSTDRRYSGLERAEALAFVEVCGGDYRAAGQALGVPWQTLCAWHREAVAAEVTEEARRKRAEIAAKLEEKVEMLVAAIDPERIAQANLFQVTAALRTLIERVEALRQCDAVTHEEVVDRLARERREVAEIIQRYVPERERRLALGAELDQRTGRATGRGEGEQR